MAVSTRLIKRRIKSIANTKKITKAMELVAASKMKKSVELTISSRGYANDVRTLVSEIMHTVDPEAHAMLTGRMDATGERKITALRTLVLVCTSDRGLCGSFNAQSLKKAFEFIRSRSSDDIRTVTVGRRGERASRRAGFSIAASFDAISSAPSYAAAKPVGDYVTEEFANGKVDRVFMVYMDYRGAMSQIPTIEQLLPIIPETTELFSASDNVSGITFEPNPSRVLDELLPRLVEMRVYQGLLESSASEHSARMIAMRSATDNANTMLDELTLTYNQARQAGITQEISEISAGKAALE
ncbi:ATP synthase F1 subunit gamma [candidate division WWE3 bacterium]|uniref:ATP synthase gamma chain n=1 Tax=candidate division WWE3 bacterium TaxID=2053526 RepID=A0A928TTS9_UNCKA|nr:ATP synthase F1 subunit gamma [candidate division WWE3 bacterium]